MKKLLQIIIVLTLLITGCKSFEAGFKFERPDIPSMIQGELEQREYLSTHFWDKIPWNDSTVLMTSEMIRKPYYEFLGVINQLGLSKASKLLQELAARSASSSNSISNSFYVMFEESLNNPNSPMREESLYLIVIDEFIRNLLDNDELKNKLIWDRELIIKNREGEIAENFTISFADGSIASLRSIASKYTLIFFFDPDCNACKEGLLFAENSPVIQHFMSKYSALAIYTGEDIQSFERVAAVFPKGWKAGRDLNNMVINERLYDRRPSPSVYLLDKEKRVIMKDGDIETAEKIIEEFIK